MTVRFVLWAILCAVLSTSAMAGGQGRLTIYTVNYPLQYFAQRIAGEHADVIFPAPTDEDPAFWQPSVDIIADYQRADLILLNGAGYAKWINRVALPRRKLVDSSAGFRDDYIHVDEGVTHSHGPGGDHSHSGTAFTTWLDFRQAAEQARAIADAMSRQRPQWETDFLRNLTVLEAELLELDQQIQSTVAAKPDLLLLASHPVYQYLQRRYGLKLQSVMWEPAEVPDEAAWSALGHILREHPAQWMIWEGEPNSESSQRLHNLGVGSRVFDPAGNRPQDGDFLDVMQQNVKNLQQVFN
jgi:zinc transport system substrate-binding protein